jgi:hypothetical protein
MIGIGLNIANRAISTYEPVSDPDANAYIIAAGITSTAEKNAINNLVISLKASGMWSSLYAFYPLMGSSLTGMSYNLKNPSEYRITWANTPTLVAGGLSFNGTSQYGDANFSPMSVSGFDFADFMFGCWDATGFNSRTEAPMGITENSGAIRSRAVWFNSNTNILDMYSNNDPSTRVIMSSAQAVGHWMFMRRNTSDVRSYWYATNTAGSSNVWTGSGTAVVSPLPTNKMFLAAVSDGATGANTPGLYSNKTYKFFYMSKATISGAQHESFVNDIYTWFSAAGK